MLVSYNMLYHTEIGESAEISVSKNFLLQGEEATGYIKLSDYQPYELVLSFPLTLTDCHLAMQTAIVKARLIGIEFGRRKKPFFKRTSSENALQSDSREFDTILRSIKNEFDEALEIRSIKELSGSNERLRDVLTNPLVAHKDFEGISSIRLLRFKETKRLTCYSEIQKITSSSREGLRTERS